MPPLRSSIFVFAFACLIACTPELWLGLAADVEPPEPPEPTAGTDDDGGTTTHGPSMQTSTSTDDVTTSSTTGTPEDADGDGFAVPQDCNDADVLVFPGQPLFFDQPSNTGSFDYDCNGVAELAHAVFVECNPPECGEEPGWMRWGGRGVIPDCGVLGDWDGGYCQHEGDPEHGPYCSGGEPPQPLIQSCR